VARGPARPRSGTAGASLFPNKTLTRWLIVAGIAVAALIIGYIGLYQYLSRQAVPQYAKGWADIVFFDIQLFVLNAAPA